MGELSDIEYVDSTINPEMGCDGCELFNPKWDSDDPRNTCYANTLVSRYAGHSKGYPVSFDTPTLFPERIAQACKWRDLTGTERPEKPWLNEMPRVIFLDDLGDTFTESLPIDWLIPYMHQIEASPHVWLMFTKRPKRMAKFFQLLGRVPSNVWPFTSVTGLDTLKRIDELLTINSPRLCVSIEPLFAQIDIQRYLTSECNNSTLAWVVAGGESGPSARPMHPDWARSLRDQCVAAGVSFFFKQWGAWTEEAFIDAHDTLSFKGRGFAFDDDQTMVLVGKKAAGRILDGRTWEEMPEVSARA